MGAKSNSTEDDEHGIHLGEPNADGFGGLRRSVEHLRA